MRRDYELGLILNPEVSEEETRAILERVEQIVSTNDGQIVRVNQWGRRRLAYPIERQRDGLYTFIDMILTPEAVTELDRTLKVSEIVLRHMVKKRDAKIVQKEREEREARAASAASGTTEEATAAPEATVAAPEATEEETPAAAVEAEPTTEVPEAVSSPAETQEAAPSASVTENAVPPTEEAVES